MKLVKFLDQKGTILVSDPLNQTILKNVVLSEYSITELAQKLNIPTLKLWRRMQKLQKANLVDLSRTEKVGNIERKLYRATATGYVPQQQYLEFKPKNPNLQRAFEIYTEIQREIMTKAAVYGEIPKDANEVDFSFFATMQAFAQIFMEPTTHKKLEELAEKISKYQQETPHLKSEVTR
ncbi:MAG: winged helix-turn-helix domain-containing protein [Chloroflexi bacterium]|nr:winged helix-turn-helix domain-containing protein [Chloroflexota bacterium]